MYVMLDRSAANSILDALHRIRRGAQDLRNRLSEKYALQGASLPLVVDDWRSMLSQILELSTETQVLVCAAAMNPKVVAHAVSLQVPGIGEGTVIPADQVLASVHKQADVGPWKALGKPAHPFHPLPFEPAICSWCAHAAEDNIHHASKRLAPHPYQPTRTTDGWVMLCETCGRGERHPVHQEYERRAAAREGTPVDALDAVLQEGDRDEEQSEETAGHEDGLQSREEDLGRALGAPGPVEERVVASLERSADDADEDDGPLTVEVPEDAEGRPDWDKVGARLRAQMPETTAEALVKVSVEAAQRIRLHRDQYQPRHISGDQLEPRADMAPRQPIPTAELRVVPGGVHHQGNFHPSANPLSLAARLVGNFWAEVQGDRVEELQHNLYIEGEPIVIYIDGDLTGQADQGTLVFNGSNPHLQKAVHWFDAAGRQRIIRDLIFLGDASTDPRSPASRIGGVAFMAQDLFGTDLAAVDNIRFEQLDLVNAVGAGSPFFMARQTNPAGRLAQGRIKLYQSKLSPRELAAYGGYGMKWASHFSGRCSPDMRHVIAEPAQEWTFYHESPQAGAVYDRCANLTRRFEGVPMPVGNGRGFMQIPNRRYLSVPGLPGGNGTIHAKGLVADSCGLWAGSSDFTFVDGHNGQVLLDRLQSVGHWGSPTDPTQPGNASTARGGIVFWMSDGETAYDPYGTYELVASDGRKYGFRSVIIRGYRARGTGLLNRDLVKLTGIHTLRLEGLDAADLHDMNRKAICVLNDWYQAGVPFEWQWYNREGGVSIPSGDSPMWEAPGRGAAVIHGLIADPPQRTSLTAEQISAYVGSDPVAQRLES